MKVLHVAALLIAFAVGESHGRGDAFPFLGAFAAGAAGLIAGLLIGVGVRFVVAARREGKFEIGE